MLLKQSDRLAIKGIILTGMLGLLSSCSNSTALENIVSADPALKKETKEVSNQTKSKTKADSLPIAENDPIKTKIEQSESTDNNSGNTPNTDNRVRANRSVREDSPSEAQVSSLTLNFPDIFPVYPQAELEEIESNEDEASGKLVWKIKDNRKAVADYYEAELIAND